MTSTTFAFRLKMDKPKIRRSAFFCIPILKFSTHEKKKTKEQEEEKEKEEEEEVNVFGLLKGREEKQEGEEKKQDKQENWKEL